MKSSNRPALGTVVLLHGLGRGPWSMKRIEWALSRDGYRVLNIGYPSREHDIATLAQRAIGPVLATHSVGEPLFFVTHSLGGILVRDFFANHQEATPPTKVVMLGPPNQGSEIVDRLRNWKPYARVNGPAGLQLGTEPESKPNQLTGIPGCEIGVIAGSVSLNPLFSSWVRGPSDGKVSVESTRLVGMSDHIVLRTSHTWMMWRGRVINQIRSFLRNGRFVSGD
jgi:triacylglycerol lipase